MKATVRLLSNVGLAFALVISIGLFSGIATAAPYGSGTYGSCNYNQTNCPTKKKTSTSSSANPTDATEATPEESTTQPPSSSNQPTSNLTDEVASTLPKKGSAGYVKWIWLAFAGFSILFFLILMARRRRKQSDMTTGSSGPTILG